MGNSFKLDLIQKSVIAICFFCNMLDGMDVLIISYSAPAIAQSFQISPSALGVVFSSGLFGMTIGAALLAPLADRFGRKPMMIFAALLMGLFIYLTASAASVTILMLYRFFSGLGIGIMLATTAALTAEYAPEKTRGFWVSFVITGYPIGAVLTGLSAVRIIEAYGWEELYKYAGIISFVAIPILWVFLRESIAYQKTKDVKKSQNPMVLFDSKLKANTTKLWMALFFCFSTLYYLLSWIPKLATDAGLPVNLALYAGIVFNIGAVVGIITQGFISVRFGLVKTVGIILLITTLFLITFGLFQGSALMLVVLFLLGFTLQSGFVGLYAIAASLYETHIRATGVGWSVGVGRIGGIVGPILGGFLLTFGLNMTKSFMVFAIPLFIAGMLTLKIKMKSNA